MPAPLTITDRRTIERALDDPALVPHGTTDPSLGSTIALRRRMARFSGPEQHPPRRAQIERLIAQLDPAEVDRLARGTTHDLSTAGAIGVDELSRTVPTVALLALLGLSIDPPVAVDDVEAIARVIGRGEPADESADAATDRLLAAVPEPLDADAAVSLLYQNFDATAALLRVTLAARSSGSDPDPAVRATRRAARKPTELAGRRLAAGDEVVLEIGAAGIQFGAGPHACPGQALAEAIVSGVVQALDETRP